MFYEEIYNDEVELPCKTYPSTMGVSRRIRNRFARKAPAYLKNSVIDFLCPSDFNKEAAVCQLDNWDTGGLIPALTCGTQVATLNHHQRQDECIYYIGQQKQRNDHSNLIGRPLVLAKYTWYIQKLIR